MTVTVSGGAGNPTPTGSVTLACGSTSLGTATLSGGSAQFTVPASSLATGSNTLTFVYTVNASSFGTYNNASGTGSVTVTVRSYMLTVNSAGLPSSGSHNLRVSGRRTTPAAAEPRRSRSPIPAGTPVTLTVAQSPFSDNSFPSSHGADAHRSASSRAAAICN